MTVEHHEQLPRCAWDGCGQDAVTYVVNHTGNDSAYLCNFHRRVALVNLEQFDTIKSPRHSEPMKRPGSVSLPPAPPPPQKPQARPGDKEKIEEWLREAAQRAEAAAVPIEPLQTDEGEYDTAKDVPDRTIITPNISDVLRPNTNQ